MKNILILLLLSVVSVVLSAPLEVVNDDELVNLFKNEKNVIVLFTKKDCEQCDNYENELIHLREDLVDSLNAWVVKAVNSQLVHLYNPSKEPALVFFRHGIPLLYDGPLNDELILHTFIENKEPVVRELSDDNFEYLTQASSGATTGDWFIMFYSTDCVDCQRLQARWEAVGAKLKSRLNVARINRQTSGAVTARRLEIRDVPTFVLLRQGKLYRYIIPKYDVGSFAAFATDWYKNARAERIPVPKNQFDDFTQMIADHIRESPLFWQIVCGLLCFASIYTIYVYAKMRTSAKTKSKSQPKKTETKIKKSK